MTNPSRHLLLIDPQNDFCAPSAQGPALGVPGADADMHRVAALLRTQGQLFEAIHVSLDAHHPIDIAHPGWWQDAEGKAPPPFTCISRQDVELGRWRTKDADQQSWSLHYVHSLELKGKYALIIWPEHCLIGTWGHQLHEEVAESLNQWARQHQTQINYVLKGMNPATEHYSALSAEVPLREDENTRLNTKLVAKLDEADQIWVAGEALSHCVASTVRDLVAAQPEMAKKLWLITDAMNSVPGFEKQGAEFLAEMHALGARLTRIGDPESNR